MVDINFQSIATVLKEVQPSPIHQIERYEMWEDIVDAFLDMFIEIDPDFDMNRFDDAVGLVS